MWPGGGGTNARSAWLRLRGDEPGRPGGPAERGPPGTGRPPPATGRTVLESGDGVLEPVGPSVGGSRASRRRPRGDPAASRRWPARSCGCRGPLASAAGDRSSRCRRPRPRGGRPSGGDVDALLPELVGTLAQHRTVSPFMDHFLRGSRLPFPQPPGGPKPAATMFGRVWSGLVGVWWGLLHPGRRVTWKIRVVASSSPAPREAERPQPRELGDQGRILRGVDGAGTGDVVGQVVLSTRSRPRSSKITVTWLARSGLASPSVRGIGSPWFSRESTWSRSGSHPARRPGAGRDHRADLEGVRVRGQPGGHDPALRVADQGTGSPGRMPACVMATTMPSAYAVLAPPMATKLVGRSRTSSSRPAGGGREVVGAGQVDDVARPSRTGHGLHLDVPLSPESGSGESSETSRRCASISPSVVGTRLSSGAGGRRAAPPPAGRPVGTRWRAGPPPSSVVAWKGGPPSGPRKGWRVVPAQKPSTSPPPPFTRCSSTAGWAAPSPGGRHRPLRRPCAPRAAGPPAAPRSRRTPAGR